MIFCWRCKYSVAKAIAISASSQIQLSSGQGLEVVGSSPPHGKSADCANETTGSNNILPDKIVNDTILQIELKLLLPHFNIRVYN